MIVIAIASLAGVSSNTVAPKLDICPLDPSLFTLKLLGALMEIEERQYSNSASIVSSK